MDLRAQVGSHAVHDLFRDSVSGSMAGRIPVADLVVPAPHGKDGGPGEASIHRRFISPGQIATGQALELVK